MELLTLGGITSALRIVEPRRLAAGRRSPADCMAASVSSAFRGGISPPSGVARPDQRSVRSAGPASRPGAEAHAERVPATYRGSARGA
jgi:hypothetical protein